MSGAEEFEIDISNGHYHAGMFEADDVIRGNLFLYHTPTVVKKGYGMFLREGLTKVVCE